MRCIFSLLLTLSHTGNCKTMAKPPAGVDDVFGAVMVLLAGVNPNVIVQKSGRVRDKDRTWDAAKKALLGNVNGFLDELKAFKFNIDEGSVPEINWKEVRPFLLLDHFNQEAIGEFYIFEGFEFVIFYRTFMHSAADAMAELKVEPSLLRLQSLICLIKN